VILSQALKRVFGSQTRTACLKAMPGYETFSSNLFWGAPPANRRMEFLLFRRKTQPATFLPADP